MAFNFGAFVGGFSEQLVKDLEAEEERQFEMEKIATTEAMRQRAAASSQRRSEQLATERMMQGLSMFYTDPKVVSYIMGSGEAGYEFAMEMGPEFLKRKMDPNTGFRTLSTNGDMSDPETQAELRETIAVAPAPEAEITAGADAGSAPTITPDTYIYGLNAQTYAQIFGEPTEYANTYAAAITNISDQLSRTTDENERAELEARRLSLLEDYAEFSAAGRAPQQETPFFSPSTLPTNINEALRNARTRYGFETDLEGNILNMTEGNEYRSYIAELSAAQTLDSTYGTLVNDPAMNNRIADIREQASRDLVEYGRRIVSEGDSRRLKNVGSQTAFAEGLISGQYRIGDVITYEDARGITRYAIYTGILNDAGIPVVMGR